MSAARSSLSTFLQHAKTALSSAPRVTIVTGNQSADLDSMTSSILYAYLRSQSPPSGAFTELYTPLLNIPRGDIALRPEFTRVFEATGVDARCLVTQDDIGFGATKGTRPSAGSTRWVLVDHNKLEGELGEVYGRRVGGVVDHHAEEDAVPGDTAPEPRVVERCGSCTSLVVRELKGTWDALPLDGRADAQLAKLALASVLVDTKNLADESKVEEADRAAVEYLVGKIQRQEPAWQQEAFFREVDGARRDIESLELSGILRKDYKAWTEAGVPLGVSSVVKPLSFLVGKASAEPSGSWDGAATEFMEQRGLEIWAVMTAFADEHGVFVRELCVQWEGDSGRDAVETFRKLAQEELGLEHMQVEGITTGGRRVWRQENVRKSRKQVAPLLRRAAKEVTKQ